MDIHSDFRELFESFNARDVEFLVVGGYALAFHGAPRFTGDMDLFINRGRENVKRILAALRDFGFASLNLTAEDFETPDRVVQLGVPPVRVDIVTSIDGVSWKEAWDGKTRGTCGAVPVYFISRREFVANKKAVGRRKDLADLEALGEE